MRLGELVAVMKVSLGGDGRLQYQFVMEMAGLWWLAAKIVVACTCYLDEHKVIWSSKKDDIRFLGIKTKNNVLS